VKEALAHTDKAIQQAKQRGDSEIRLIVGLSSATPVSDTPNDNDAICAGKGLHSPGGATKIKPAIEQLMQKYVVIFSSLFLCSWRDTGA
jgi:hypothetical protein